MLAVVAGAECLTSQVMSGIEECVDQPLRGGLAGELDVVRGLVSDAALALRRALVAEWVSVAAEGYREAIDARLDQLHRLTAELDKAEVAVRRAESAQHAGTPWPG